MKPTDSKAAKTRSAPLDKDNTLVQLEIPLLIFLLKKLSSKDHPISVSEITKYMNDLTPSEHSDKTLRRKLQILYDAQHNTDDDLETVSNSLLLTLGGTIEKVTNERTNIKKTQSKYYFQPVLDASDVAMICGSITSNRYLTAKEKDYLLSREQLLTSFKTDVREETQITVGENGRKEINIYHTYSQTTLPEKPTSSKTDSKSKIDLLHHVNQLHHAIENGYSLQIVYGIYTLDKETKSKISLQPRNQKAYLINPYALLWNGGFYYLLATHRGHDNPVHFRVDRIMTIKPMPQADDARLYEPCEALPKVLHPYFKTEEDEKPEFLTEAYTASYPLMGIYDELDPTNCVVECTAGTLSILIDTFGRSLSIHPSPLTHGDDELDIHGNPQQFFAVRIPNVQYDNMLQFCLQQHASITALHPPKLVEDIEIGLLAALERCKKAKLEVNPRNPFKRL